MFTYNELGQLTCILCKSIVRSADVWKVHINAKQHKQNVKLAKQLKEKTKNFTAPAAAASSSATFKRPGQPLSSEVPAKVPKGILKNAVKPPNAAATINAQQQQQPSPVPTDSNGLPVDFFDGEPSSYFDSTLRKTSIKTDLVNIKRGNDISKQSTDLQEEMEVDKPKDEILPEGFFDDPVKDAKARHLDYKDPVELEWEKFQQEIKEASDQSNALIAEEQVEATTERQFDEIDEQMRNWTR